MSYRSLKFQAGGVKGVMETSEVVNLVVEVTLV